MFVLQMRAAIEAAQRKALPELAAALWRAHGAGAIGGEEAQGLAELIEARKVVAAVAEKAKPRRQGSRPKTGASLDRRRRWVASGMMPPSIACQFTTGEAAALAVIAVEVQKRGRCELPIGAIAATAGICETTVRNALRQARALGLVDVKERRLSWTRNLPNRVAILSSEWLTWLKIGRQLGGGCKTVRGTPTHQKTKAFSPLEKQVQRARERHRIGRPLTSISPSSVEKVPATP